MKTYSTIRLGFFVLISTWILLVNCKDEFLEKPPLGQLDLNQLANKKGVEGLLIGAYSLLDGQGGNKGDIGSSGSNWIFGSICGSEAYTGSFPGDGNIGFELFQISTNTNELAGKWGIVYDGIERSNNVLRVLNLANDISPSDQVRITAEARFLRGFYHFEAKKMWNRVPYIDESITYSNGNYRVANDKDIWPQIEQDLNYATEHLAELSYQGAPGRVNKFSAMALLAKAYLFQQKYKAAKPLLDQIIQSGKYHLVNYHDNFNAETKNNPESVFSAQMSVNDGAEGQNGNLGQLFNFPVNNGPGGCCGFFQPTQFLVNHFKTDPITGLPDLYGFNRVDVKNDLAIPSDQPFETESGTLDPRLDWTVGRRGIPFLDWGNHPGWKWIRQPNYSGTYSPKKNIHYKRQEGSLTDATFWANITNAINVNLIRYADVLLWAAEVEIESGNLEKAREYVNQIRNRAADPAGWVRKTDGTPAANYKIGKYEQPWTNLEEARLAVRYERILELAMEGHRFFDLVRWGTAATEINDYLLKEKLIRIYLNPAKFVAGCHEYFPIPQTQIDLSAGSDGIRKMQQNPCY